MPKIVSKEWPIQVKLSAEDMMELLAMIKNTKVDPNGHKDWWVDQIQEWGRNF